MAVKFYVSQLVLCQVIRELCETFNVIHMLPRGNENILRIDFQLEIDPPQTLISNLLLLCAA